MYVYYIEVRYCNKELQLLHQQHGDKVVVIGFPANNFGSQEPGTEKDIAAFCEKNYGWFHQCCPWS